jgi:hypothetical protein
MNMFPNGATITKHTHFASGSSGFYEEARVKQVPARIHEIPPLGNAGMLFRVIGPEASHCLVLISAGGVGIWRKGGLFAWMGV